MADFRLLLPRRRRRLLLLAGLAGLMVARRTQALAAAASAPAASASASASAPTLGAAPESAAASSAPQRFPPPLAGPDFALAKVDAWGGPPGAETELVLFDGSRWHLDPRSRPYDLQRRVIASAINNDLELFVSGDRGTGAVERVAQARRLAAMWVREPDADGRRAVQFQLLPSIYFLRMDVAGAQQALELLQRSARKQAMPDQPDVLVGIDTAHSEILVVKAFERP